MPDFNPVELGLSVIPSAYKFFSGLNQVNQGKRMRSQLVRPTYVTPNEIFKNTDLARTQFLDTRLPGQSVAENKLQGNTGQAINLANQYGRTPAEIMSVITGANANENNSFNDLATKASERQLMDLRNYQDTLNTEAGYKNKEFEYNKWLPYVQDAQAAAAMIGAGNQNIYGGINDATSGLVGAGVGSAFNLNDVFNRIFKKNRSPITATRSYGTNAQNLTGDEESYFSPSGGYNNSAWQYQ